MKISAINIYPVKSLKGIGLTHAEVEKRGLMYDRRWMLTDRQGIFFTQREFPTMATISVEVGEECLSFSAPSGDDLRLPMDPTTGDRRQVTVWQSICEGEVYGEEVNSWFSDVLGTDCQLVHMPTSTERHVSERFDTGGDIVSFADGYPLLLIGESSLADLNSRLPVPVPMNRFRPNLVVSDSRIFEEDTWSRIKIGSVTFRVVKPCARCVITTVDQAIGEFDGKEPLRTIASFRSAGEVYPNTFESMGLTAASALFGQNLIPESPGGSVSVGDEVEVIARNERM